MRRTLFAAALALTLVACGGAPRSDGSSSGTLLPAADAMEVKPTPPYPRLDGALNAVLASERPLETAVERGLRVQEERIQVTISTAPQRVASLSGWLSEQGAHNLSSAGGEVQADVSVEVLRTLAGRDEVMSVRRPAAIRDPGLH